jgi:hypothetical protein
VLNGIWLAYKHNIEISIICYRNTKFVRRRINLFVDTYFGYTMFKFQQCVQYLLQTRSQQDKLGDDELRMKSSAVEITTVEQLRNRITKVAKHKYIRRTARTKH